MAFLEPVTRKFVDGVNANAANGPPLYTLAPADARAVLEDLQSSDNSLTDEFVDAQTLATPSGTQVVIFTPKGDASGRGDGGALPIVLYTHGGGWILGSPNTHARLVRSLVKATGYAFVFVHYTNAPEGTWDVVTKQTYDALTWVVEKAESLNLDKNRVAVAGDSAGGNLAIANTLNSMRHGNAPQISATVLLYPVTNISKSWDQTESMKANGKGLWLETPVLDWMYKAYAPDAADRDNVLNSPLLAHRDVLEEFPPTLLVVVGNDPLRDEGEAFAEKLAGAGVDVFSLRVNQTVHDYLLLNPLRESAAVKGTVDLIAGFLRRHLN